MKKAIPASHMAEYYAMINEREGKPFRRQDLSARVFKRVSPRTQVRANVAADRVIKEAFDKGLIIRHGHLHWVVANQSNTCTLKSGRNVPVQDKVVPMSIRTYTPEKWACVDMETGQMFVGNKNGEWIASSTAERNGVAKMITKKAF